jgi:hypothetical protein
VCYCFKGGSVDNYLEKGGLWKCENLCVENRK